ncbi:ammonia-forming cytochrome c nitrite reductase subunit c552 [Ferrimonas marina]|uniref:nitrite reductase (cytochrome; ammonia-forming) n=1 Tax=Ferrimonas marina TaxID=299255 RepID=A0A1M5X2X3_9GAMM|nr:ammonia-forming cytochrome c nitrite reductase subunit c552 [Ferrimonas marina]SHH94159.1 nitrite reductase (cytochrome c-552) [Ferrimonas marina]
MKKLALAMAVATFSCGAAAKTVVSDNEAWKDKYPNQYASWAETQETDAVIDLLEKNPNLVILWGGYGFMKDYKKARGHQFAVTDVVQTLRTGAPMGDMDGPMPASCWSCKTPDSARMIAELGEAEYSAKKFGALGHEMSNAIGCADCHDGTSPKLTLSRPFAERAMETVDLAFADQDRKMQGSQTCAQCHVEYYFDPTNSGAVKFPWDMGMNAEQQLAYYDSIGFADWTHAVSKAPMLKAQHPEFETWAPSIHAELGVTCVDCHMPKVSNDEGRKFSKHNVGNTMDNFDVACSSCHDSKSDMEDLLKANKAEIQAKQALAEEVIVRAHFEAGAAWDAGADEAEMKQALTKIRHAQWLWDFAIASHAIHAHNPSESLRLLDSAKATGLQAQAELKKVLDKHGVKQPVALPDFSTKAKAQALLGFDKAADQAAKDKFVEERAKGQWETPLK